MKPQTSSLLANLDTSRQALEFKPRIRLIATDQEVKNKNSDHNIINSIQLVKKIERIYSR